MIGLGFDAGTTQTQQLKGAFSVLTNAFLFCHGATSFRLQVTSTLLWRVSSLEVGLGTVGFREIETTVFDPASVFLSTH